MRTPKTIRAPMWESHRMDAGGATGPERAMRVCGAKSTPAMDEVPRLTRRPLMPFRSELQQVRVYAPRRKQDKEATMRRSRLHALAVVLAGSIAAGSLPGPAQEAFPSGVVKL